MREYIKDNLGFVLIMGVLVLSFVFVAAVNQKSDSISKNKVKTIQGLKEFNKPQREHVQGSVQYAESPPTGGNHNQVWIGCDAKTYDQEVLKEMAVHSLEHGAVWVTYQPTLEKSKIDLLKTKVKTSGNTFLSPYPEQKAPIVLSAWGRQLEINDAKDPRIDQFMVKFRKGEQTPEPGATCTAPEGTGQPSSGSGSGLAPGETPEQHARESQQQ